MYDFESALGRIQVLRETARKGNYMPALRMLTTYLEQASIRNQPEELAKGLLHRAILHMHRHERASEDNETFLAQYYSDVDAGIQICYHLNLDSILEAQLERRMGDYYYESDEHEEAIKHYTEAINLLPNSNGIRFTEYTAPLDRSLVLARRTTEEAFARLESASKKANRKPKKMSTWQWLIIRSGVAMKYAEAAYAVDSTRNLCEKLLKKAEADARYLDRLGYHQRLIQFRRLRRKLNFAG